MLIDWGWFYFITKPMFLALDCFYRLVGNFGLAILMVTVLVKILFFPLANKSYESMAKMKKVQPQMMEMRERYQRQGQAAAGIDGALQAREDQSAGRLPADRDPDPGVLLALQGLFVTIEMRHAPFFGWIHDLSAQDPTNMFNLFGLIPLDPTVCR